MSQITLKFVFFFGSLLGIFKFNLPKKSSKWIKFISLLYYNCFNIISISLCILNFLQLPSVVSRYVIMKRSDIFITSILKIVCDSTYVLWYIVYFIIVLYYRFNNHKVKLLCKYSHVSLKMVKYRKSELSLLLLFIGYKVTFVIAIASIYINYLPEGFFSITILILLLFTCFGISNFSDIFLCLNNYSSIILKTLEKEIHQYGNKNTNFEIVFKNQKISTIDQLKLIQFQRKILLTKRYVEYIYQQLQAIISFIFLSNFLYTCSFITKVATETNAEIRGSISYISCLIYILFLIAFGDAPNRKVTINNSVINSDIYFFKQILIIF